MAQQCHECLSCLHSAPRCFSSPASGASLLPFHFFPLPRQQHHMPAAWRGWSRARQKRGVSGQQAELQQEVPVSQFPPVLASWPAEHTPRHWLKQIPWASPPLTHCQRVNAAHLELFLLPSGSEGRLGHSIGQSGEDGQDSPSVLLQAGTSAAAVLPAGHVCPHYSAAGET